MGPAAKSRLFKEEAIRLGFDACGISRARFLKEEAANLEEWLNRGYQGEMRYMENHFDKRLDPSKLVPGSKSVISLSYNYFPADQQVSGSYKISKYAYGEDYHLVIKDKLRELIDTMKEKIGDFHARVFTDSAPIMERSWAELSGLGWIGKHSLLINRKRGSFFFLAEIITELDLEEDRVIKTDHCGTCTRCIDACPTDAILPKKTLDASKCISYLTIELRNEIPNTFANSMDDWQFGCDICQDVCPWNRFSEPHHEERFLPRGDLLAKSKSDWMEMSEPEFDGLFAGSAVQRTGFKGLRRNLDYLDKHKSE